MATGTDFWADSDMCKHESICVSMNMNKKILPALLLAVCCWAGASAQQVAVKTNLLYWAAATPNVGAEVAVGKHSTLGFSANYNPWTIGLDNKIQHWFIRPEYRYWVTEKYTRLFFGVHAIGGKFEDGESPEDCMFREVNEETGLTPAEYRYRGLVTFVSDRWPTEYMHLFTIDRFTGTLRADCPEGDLEWLALDTAVHHPPLGGGRDLSEAH